MAWEYNYLEIIRYMKILHLACVHKSNDTRILIKECYSLAKSGYEVVFYTSVESKQTLDEEERELNGVYLRFHDLDMRGVVLNREIIKSVAARKKNVKKILNILEKERPDVVHIHEFELVYSINAIKKKFPFVKIIYDVHEDVFGQYLPHLVKIFGNVLGQCIAKVIERKEIKYFKKVDAIITVTPYLYDKIKKHNDTIAEIRNMPMDITSTNDDLEKRENIVCYCGGLTEQRGITTLFKIANQINGIIILAGAGKKEYLEKLDIKYDVNDKIVLWGYVGREKINELYSTAVVGVCTLLYSPNIYNAYPIKLFEYMAAGIPVVCSDFPLWKSLVEKNECGIAVNPDNEQEIIEAINYLLSDRKIAQRMGQNGKDAVKKKYNWKIEEQKLMDFYQNLLQGEI